MTEMRRYISEAVQASSSDRTEPGLEKRRMPERQMRSQAPPAHEALNFEQPESPDT